MSSPMWMEIIASKYYKMCEKNTEMGDFDQGLECTAPKRWLKYTTMVSVTLSVSFRIGFLDNILDLEYWFERF